MQGLQAAQALVGQVLADEGGEFAGEEEPALQQVGAGVGAAVAEHAGGLGVGAGEQGREGSLHLFHQCA